MLLVCDSAFFWSKKIKNNCKKCLQHCVFVLLLRIMTNELNSILNADTRAAHAAKLEAQARAFTASLNVGDWIAWENGIGITEVEQVRLSKRLGELVVRGAFNNEIRIYTLARIPNNHRKYTAPAK